MSCPFCEIVSGRATSSVVFDSEDLLSFMTTRPTAPGECLIIPKAHIDHFTDIDDELAAQIMRVAQRIGRRMRLVFKPDRIGFLVHGFGVPHAHLIVVPQHGPHHLTSDRFAHIEDGQIVFHMASVPTVARETLDHHARLLGSDDDG